MKVLVTGSNTKLGQHVFKTLSGEIYDLVGCDMGEVSLINSIPHSYVKQDLTNRRATIDLIKSLQPQIIVHTAALTNVDKCELEKEFCWKINVEATDTILQGAAKVEAKVIFISSDYVFDGVKGPYTEQAVPNPICYYGKSKLAAENLIRGSGITSAILRTIVLYGVGVSVRASFVTWLLGMLREGRQVFIVNDQWGNTTLVNDLAKAIERVILLEKYGLFHIAGRDFLSRFEFAQRIAEIFDLDKGLINPISTSDLRQPAPRPMKSGLVSSYAEQELFVSFHNVQESLEIYKAEENHSN